MTRKERDSIWEDEKQALESIREKVELIKIQQNKIDAPDAPEMDHYQGKPNIKGSCLEIADANIDIFNFPYFID